MKTKVDKRAGHFKVEIGLKSNRQWNETKLSGIKSFVQLHATKRSVDRKRKNELLSVKYQMEEYLSNEKVNARNLKSLEDFLQMYLVALSITFKKFATSIDTTDSNLKKYLSGERKFSTDLAFKFSHFFHTTPDLWINVDVKNELIVLKAQKKQINKYKKYNYQRVLA